MNISKAQTSKINSIDFDKLAFGKTFTDHMFICRYQDGKWQDPEIKPYQSLTLDPSSSVFHYGQAVFEGMKAFKDDQDQIWLFRPEENFKRINRSANRLQIPEFPESYFFEGLNTLLSMDKDWIKPGKGNSLYIRPFVFASQASVQASAANEYFFMIICAPVKSYYTGGEINVLIAEEYSRAANGGVGFAKAAGNYAAQFYPTSEALKDGFQQIIWTDANSHQYLEEAGTMNIFFKINNTLITSPTNDRILDGITRKSIIDLAKHSGLSVEERPIKVQEIKDAHQAGTLEEVFGTGTAVVVLPINSFSHQKQVYKLPKETPLANSLKEKLLDIQYNLAEDPFEWRRGIN
ncbi:branched-chain amino acid aminotransferase [Flavobacteriaceae bacterium]|jgi:branched-chain amino acid aminotransferase|nr:branched-chain amino acid aminotransferase [Flavobacteriaceae bacterium]MDC0386841.1 branched-chain amino acid aminotransferase [Flavobacteriaceae bacterium]